ncbi:Glycosyl transferase, group 1 [Sterolibacterium denitrificans]|uniref:Glycosyl transferase, group 1 n=1 Tax=Sterolibacterium denitrificans TaxID=157592 RepID=A0A7Z7MUB0_9PROT|nr:glycosyltransferase [Sterolibacterium denitrificans]SMB22409.1 Glycosyl transferase, group 1 [Sterolibacterium denitrificans]
MRIVIDMQGAQSNGSWNRGIGRYTMALAKAMVRHCRTHEILLALNGAFPDSIERIRAAFDGVLPGDNIKVWHPLAPAAFIAIENKPRRQISECVREAFLTSLAPDVVLVSSLFEGLGDDAVTGIDVGEHRHLTAVILYDLIPYIHQSPYLENPDTRNWYLGKIEQLKNAGLWLAISESSRQEGIQRLGFPSTRCLNISTDADAQFGTLEQTTAELAAIKQKYGIRNGFVMYTGGIDFRKNIEGLIRAYSLLPKQLRQRHQLAIVCSVHDASRHQLLALAKKQGLGDGELILTGFVPEADLIGLYGACTLFVFPSWHEGFGLPALEAMRCGAPVIASNLSSLPEVVGMDEALFDPHSDTAIARLMERALTDEAFRKRLRENSRRQSARFSWDDTARRAIAAMEQAHAEKIRQDPAASKNLAKPKLAYVSPLPPERSGIADYSAELLPVLSGHYQIEVIVEQKNIANPWIREHCPVRSVAWFMQHAHAYDRVLYHFGNSHFHQHMFAMLQAVPGVVVLHDFHLSNIEHHMQATGYAPGFFTQALYQSHGYAALQDLARAEDIAEVVWKYPASRAVLENSVGTIVHSPNSVHLAQRWYGLDTSSLKIIPHLRVPDANAGSARRTLGFADDDFIVCAFGLLGPHKLNHRLLQAWLDSDLARDSACHLVFVGKNHDGDYGDELASAIKRSSCAARIRITGWASPETFKNYLAAADVGVQLRALSRGETSGAVLDCMNHGLPTIVNANGSMADLDEAAVWMLPDEFDDAELVQALETLWRNPAKRTALGKNARNVILDRHDPGRCAQSYAESIEHFYRTNPPVLFDLYPKLAGIMAGAAEDGDLRKLAHNLALSFPPRRKAKQLFVDISELVQRDAKAGIQRVVRSILKEWLSNPPRDFRIEPVYATLEQGYRYARRFTADFMNWPHAGLADEPIDYASGDMFFGLDLQPEVQAAQRRFYRSLRSQGVRVKFLVHDLLCIRMPQFFSPGVKDAFLHWLEVVAETDGAVCVSRIVADELTDWIRLNNPRHQDAFEIDWSHNGAGERAGADTKAGNAALSGDVQAILARLDAHPGFLMVGTLEPRKGHGQVLDAFEQLWREGVDINLAIVGKQGWLVDALVERLHGHPELGKRLFWLAGIGDEYLEKVYAASTCLIAASCGEGFGLPLIEAAQHRLPIIARDIPVFREVAGDCADYFIAEHPADLARAIKSWLASYRQGKHPKPDEMPWLTWKESAENLAGILLGNRQ